MVKYNCLNAISELGLKYFPADYQAVEDVKEADCILVRSAKMHDMEFSENLMAIARAGAGVNNIPLEDCAKKGIVVFNTPGANANGVKELVLAGMLLASRDIIGGVEWVREHAGEEDIAKVAEKQKKQFAGHEIQGKKLGIIGLGAIGQLVANAAVGLGMDVYGFDPYISVDAAWNLSRSVHHVQDVKDIYKNCDFITIHVPAMDATKGMISKEAIAMMKEGVVVLNYARDILVDEDALLEALKAGKIGRYMTDFANDKVCNVPGVIVTPHLGASTVEAEDHCAIMAVKELKEYMENGNIRNSVNYPNCDMGECSAEGRIAVFHKNVPQMISRFSSIIGEVGLNIENFFDRGKGEHSYSLLDVSGQVPQDLVTKLEEIEGVYRVRIVK